MEGWMNGWMDWTFVTNSVMFPPHFPQICSVLTHSPQRLHTQSQLCVLPQLWMYSGLKSVNVTKRKRDQHNHLRESCIRFSSAMVFNNVEGNSHHPTLLQCFTTLHLFLILMETQKCLNDSNQHTQTHTFTVFISLVLFCFVVFTSLSSSVLFQLKP